MEFLVVWINLSRIWLAGINKNFHSKLRENDGMIDFKEQNAMK